MLTRQIATGAFAVLAMVLTAAPGRSQLTTGTEYLDRCRDADQADQADFSGSQFVAGWCYGFIYGVTAGMPIVEHLLADAGHTEDLLCVPDGVTNKQLVRVVVRYVSEHPEKQHMRAAVLLFGALRESFPCGGDAG